MGARSPRLKRQHQASPPGSAARIRSLMAVFHWWRTRQRSIALATVNMLEIGFLLLASLYAFVIVLNNRIDFFDTMVLVAMFGACLWQAGRMPKVESGLEADDEPGPAAALATLPLARQWAWMGGLAVVAAAVILASAEPFAESIVASGRVHGIDERSSIATTRRAPLNR